MSTHTATSTTTLTSTSTVSSTSTITLTSTTTLTATSTLTSTTTVSTGTATSTTLSSTTSTATTATMTSTTTLITVTMTTTTDTTITTTTPLGATTTITVTTQTSTTTQLFSVDGTMWFESTGSAEQVERASVTALAASSDVPESTVTCVASVFTPNSRRLMSDRELTSSVTYWQVDWTTIVREYAAISAYNLGTELHTHVNATTGENLEVIEEFYSLMLAAMSSEGLTLVSNSSVLVHAEPRILLITNTQTTSTTATTSATTSTVAQLIADMENTASIDFLIIGIIAGAVVVLCCCVQAVWYLRSRQYRKSEEDLEAVPRSDLEHGTPEDILWVAPGAPPRRNPLPSGGPTPARSLSRGGSTGVSPRAPGASPRHNPLPSGGPTPAVDRPEYRLGRAGSDHRLGQAGIAVRRLPHAVVRLSHAPPLRPQG
ncbi:unnamed protein product [Prorocentrum cordatum]|uniref:Uncharacterized protein n=1 Tax=Prorocentrum cordatum TaxID=2364126 RepID=A0ABN9S211_9DINO|nr:unnamed protein product [Polarella glacialis]